MPSSSHNAHHLTDTQLVLLSQASQRADGKIVPSGHLKGGVFQRVMASLVGKGLVQPALPAAEAPSGQSGDDPVEPCPVISPAGLAALGITDGANVDASGDKDTVPGDVADSADAPGEAGGQPGVAAAIADGHRPNTGRSAARANPGVTADTPLVDSQVLPELARSPRAGSKQVTVLELLARPDGATLDAVMTATGWLPHTTRAVLSGLRKRGHGIERRIDGEGCSRYRLTASTPSAA